MKPTRQQLLQRLAMLRAERSTWWSTWKEASDYMLPRAGRYFVSDRNKGWKRTANIYNNTGTRAVKTLAAGLMGGMTSPARPWFKLGTMDPELATHQASVEWLSDATELMQMIFQRSNVYRALHQMYLELGTFGTAAAVFDVDFDNVVHLHFVTTGQYYIAHDAKEKVDTFYREYDMTAGQIYREFGKDNVSRQVSEAIDKGQPDQWITVVHAMQPRIYRDAAARDNLNMPFESVYFERAGEEDKFLRIGGYKRFRALVPRWELVGGDIYGNCPGQDSIGDVKSLQQLELRKAECLDYLTKPPIQVPSALAKEDINRMPGGITHFDGTPNSAIKPLWEVQLDINSVRGEIDAVERRINSAFYADLFLMLSSQPPDGRMTATEVAQRYEEKMLMLGPVLERLNNELLNPLIEMTFERMMSAQLLPPPPEALQGTAIKVEYVSMLAQAQRAIGVNAIDRWMANIGQIAQMKPEILDKIDVDEYVNVYADKIGVDPDLIVPDEKVAAIRKQRQQQQQAAQAAQAAQSTADTAQKLGKVQTQGGSSNAAADIMNQFSGYATPQSTGP